MELAILIGLFILQLELLVLVAMSRTGRSWQRGFKHPVFVDTSVIIDGRIASAVEAGFIPSELIIPSSVVAELQLLADSGDSEKRLRARQGLELIRQLKDTAADSIRVYEDGTAMEGVDNRLMELAARYKGSICTIDYNLAKAAEAKDIRVLNINELAKNLRMTYLPGEKVSLEIVSKGNDSTQGVGYLADGTMVVVEQAKSDIGNIVEVEFIRSIQTAAGRMLFAKKLSKPSKQPPNRGTKPAKSPRRKPSSPENSLIESINNQ